MTIDMTSLRRKRGSGWPADNEDVLES